MVAGSNLSWQGIKRKAVYTVGAGPVCKRTYLGMQNFLNWFLKLTNQK